MKKNTILSLFCASVLISCGGGESSGNGGTMATKIKAERGPIVNAIVMDANNNIAKELGNGEYEFNKKITYPIVTKGGFVDLDGDGELSFDDMNLKTISLKSYSEVITPITTLLATSSDATQRLQKQNELESMFNISDLANKTMLETNDVKMMAVADVLFDKIAKKEDINNIDIQTLKDPVKTKEQQITKAMENGESLANAHKKVEKENLPQNLSSVIEALKGKLITLSDGKTIKIEQTNILINQEKFSYSIDANNKKKLNLTATNKNQTLEFMGDLKVGQKVKIDNSETEISKIDDLYKSDFERKDGFWELDVDDGIFTIKNTIFKDKKVVENTYFCQKNGDDIACDTSKLIKSELEGTYKINNKNTLTITEQDFDVSVINVISMNSNSYSVIEHDQDGDRDIEQWYLSADTAIKAYKSLAQTPIDSINGNFERAGGFWEIDTDDNKIEAENTIFANYQVKELTYSCKKENNNQITCDTKTPTKTKFKGTYNISGKNTISIIDTDMDQDVYRIVKILPTSYELVEFEKDGDRKIKSWYLDLDSAIKANIKQ